MRLERPPVVSCTNASDSSCLWLASGVDIVKGWDLNVFKSKDPVQSTKAPGQQGDGSDTRDQQDDRTQDDGAPPPGVSPVVNPANAPVPGGLGLGE